VTVSPRALNLRHAARFLVLLAMLPAGPSFPSARAFAQDGLRDPREIATTDDEAGKRQTVVADEDGTDEFGRWTHRRWIRDRESSDLHVRPVVTDNKVWVTPDVDTARKLFQIQVDKMRDFPERDVQQDAAKGPFPFEVKEGPLPKDFADEAAALSACVDCDVKTVILTHRRIVLRKGSIVEVMYIFGREDIATPEVAVWHAMMVADRM
jgi:hypothetical protein